MSAPQQSIGGIRGSSVTDGCGDRASPEAGLDGRYIELANPYRRVEHGRIVIIDLAALEARSRVHEAEALCDASGLGAFTVAIWRR